MCYSIHGVAGSGHHVNITPPSGLTAPQLPLPHHVTWPDVPRGSRAGTLAAGQVLVVVFALLGQGIRGGSLWGAACWGRLPVGHLVPHGEP